MTEQADVVVIGGGIAGASAAAEIAETARVILLERESAPGLHATGRSAALFSLTYGGRAVQPLTRASEAFYRSTPDGFAPTALVHHRGVLIVAPSEQRSALVAQEADAPGTFLRLTPAEARDRLPVLRPGYAQGALYNDAAADIDVDAVHQGYLRRLRGRGGEVVCDAGVESLQPTPSGWRVRAGGRAFDCAVVVNAAGAWGDAIAVLAGVAPIGLQPKRRTAAVIEGPNGSDAWPFLIDAAETFYLKPTSGKLLLSPADETDQPAGEVYPDDEALAEGVERLGVATTLTVTRQPRTWAGLRTFTPDRAPAIGFDAERSGYFHLVGQGGFGMQTAPAVSRLAAALVAGRALPPDLSAHGVTAAAYDPGRFRPAAV
jgi:D-arginine dehydrogenase